MKNIFLILTVLFFHFYSCAQSSILKTGLTPEQWKSDVRYFKEQMVKRHKNAFHHVSKEEFENDVAQLMKDIPSLKDYEIVVRITQITSKIGDGHTRVLLPSGFQRYPLLFNWFGDSLYVIATIAKYNSALGTRLSKIGGMSLEEIMKRLKTVMIQDQNKWFEMNVSAGLISIPEILFSLGIVPDHDNAEFIFLDADDKEIRLNIATAPAGNFQWIPASKSQPLFRQNLNDPFWFTYVEEINAVYVSFKKYDELARNANKLFDFIDEKKASRLIVDLRLNGGGDFFKGRRQLLSRIKENNIINQKGNLFVIVGRRTFSAAMVNTIDFKKETNAIIIGEPLGDKPNGYSENDEMKLPNSGLVVSYSTRYYKFLDEDIPVFEPDIRIDPDWISYKEGRDPVLERIIVYCKKHI
jgi:hypothetical protein